MNRHLTIKEITELSAHSRVWATEMDLVVSKTRELSMLKDHQLEELNATLKRVNSAIFG